MADQALRDLERKAAAGDAHAALDLARARVRAGDHVAALEAVWQACAEPGLRDEAAQLALDQGPLRTAPRVAWETKLGRSVHGHVTATSLVIEAGSELVDPSTGRGRGRARGQTWFDGAMIVEFRKVGRNRIVAGLDAWTGEELHRTAIPGEVVGVGGGMFLARKGGEVVAYRGSDRRAAPAEVWRRAVPTGPLDIAVAADTAALHHRRAAPETVNTIELLSAADGARRATIEGVRLIQVDEDGLLGESRLDGPALPPTPVAFDRAGARAWQLLGETARGRALVGRSRDHLLYGRTIPTPGAPEPGVPPWTFADRGGVDLLIVHRRTGAIEGSATLQGRVAALAGDVVFHVWADELAATTLGGTRLWSWRRARGRRESSVPAVASLPGRVVVRFGSTLTCLVGE